MKKILEEKLKKLREKRNKLYDEAEEVQKEIDNIILEDAKFNNYLGKYVIYKCQDGSEIYMHVTSIKRLTNGATFGGPMMDCIMDTLSYACGNFSSFDTVQVKTIDSIKEITKEEFMAVWNKFVYEFGKVLS